MILIILKYDSGNVEIIRDVPDKIENLEEFVSNLGYKLSEISYMYTDDNFLIEYYTYNKDKLIYHNINLWN